jgi:hypothetical protein
MDIKMQPEENIVMVIGKHRNMQLIFLVALCYLLMAMAGSM